MILPSRDGVGIAVHCFDGPADGPVLLWCHANGFSTGSYRPFLNALGESLRVVAFDLRGQGESAAVGEPYADTLGFARLLGDFLAVHEWLRAERGGDPVFAGGHSLGALLPLAAQAQDIPLAGLVLVEAAVFPPPGHALHADAVSLTLNRGAKIPHRRARWDTPASLARSLARAPAFSTMPAAHLALHCAAALAQSAEGDYRLRCDPAVEAHLYGEVMRAGQHEGLARVRCPTLVVGADVNHPGATWATRMQDTIHARIAASTFVPLAGVGHLAPIEAPEPCARIVRDWIERESA